jgi:hypothetical protein
MGDRKRALQEPANVAVMAGDRVEQGRRRRARVAPSEVRNRQLHRLQRGTSDRGQLQDAGQPPGLRSRFQLGDLVLLAEQLDGRAIERPGEQVAVEAAGCWWLFTHRLTRVSRLSVLGRASPLAAACRRSSATSFECDQPCSLRTVRRVLLPPAMPCPFNAGYRDRDLIAAGANSSSINSAAWRSWACWKCAYVPSVIRPPSA